MSFFSTPLSGLNASSSALATISNNLSNMNTNGYKSENNVFSDVFYQNLGTSGNNNPIQAGFGVKVQGMSIDLTNGNVSSTGVASNMALDGDGYFITSSTSGGAFYTRSGDFTTNTSGQLVTPGGNLLMGYPATGGVVNTSASLQPINVGQGASIASATSNFSMTTNLNASASVGTTYSPAPLTVYDSLGGSHLLSINYTKTGANTWSYNVSIPSSDIQNGAGTTTSLGSGTLTFDASGALSSPTGNLQLNSVGPFTDGAAAMSPVWQLSSSTSALLTQTASDSTSSAQSQNGYAAGTLSGYSVLANGTVQGTFSNGQTHAIGQVAVADFPNPEGLQLTGNNTYQITAASGQAVVGVAGTGGRGTIIGSSVEQSNVDVATQLSDLIVAQRSYEANAKAITTLDQIEQDTISMKSA